MTKYTCQTCGIAVAVVVENGQTTLIRPCGHDTAPVIASVSAHATGNALVALSRK